MTDSTQTEESTTTTAEPNEGDLGDAGKRAIAAERKRAEIAEKSLKALQDELTKRETAELTELERFKRENEELRTGKSTSELEATRYRVALEKGIPADLAARLQGASYDEIAADADTLASLIPANGKPPVPRADLSQGAKQQHAAPSPADAFAETLRKLTGRD
jgi:hypothetical protein